MMLCKFRNYINLCPQLFPCFASKWHKFARGMFNEVTSLRLWCILISQHDQNKCGTIRTRKYRSTNWLTIWYMLSIVQKPSLSWCRGRCFKKGGGCHFPYLIFSRFIIFTLEITLPFAKLCYAFIVFVATIILCNKVILH